MHGATPQAHHKARNEEPCIYPPYSVPEANGNEPGDQVQEVYPGFVATANRFIETGTHLFQPSLFFSLHNVSCSHASDLPCCFAIVFQCNSLI